MLALTIAGGTSSAVLGALMVYAGFARHRTPPVFAPETADQDAVFVFSGSELVDASDRGRKLLETLGQAGDAPLDAILAFLRPRFSDLNGRLRTLAAQGRLDLTANDGTGLSIVAQMRAGLVHLRVIDPQDEGALVALDRLSLQAMQDELVTLRNVAAAVPVLAWAQDGGGQIVWANDAYIDMLGHVAGGGLPLTWPLPALFADAPQSGRLLLNLDLGPRWYAHRSEERGGQVLHFATPIDSAVQSELARREMLQMLTRTFAALPIGLALFDAERRLQVFNPALVDLTGLDPFFLAARPDLGQVLHILREQRLLPEPKDFTTWRDELMRLEAAAANGTYNEEWILPGGRTYQVRGSPQPNGALAFFIQDVTSDATLLRGIRAEVEFTDQVMDALPHAIVAFDRKGQTTLSNTAYAELWGQDPCVDLFDAGFEQALAAWQKACDSGPGLERLARFVAAESDGTHFATTATLRDGCPIAIQARHLAQGGVLVCFRPIRPDESSHALAADRARDQAQLLAARAQVQARLHAADLSDDDDRTLRAGPDQLAPLALRGRGRSVRHVGSRLRL